MGVIENDNDISGEKSEPEHHHHHNNETTAAITNGTIVSTSTEDHRRLENGVGEVQQQAAPLIISADITSNNQHNSSVASDTCDMASLEILKRRDMYPIKSTVCDDDKCLSIIDQLPILNGEYVQFVGPSGKLNDEILLLTNYRLFLLMHDSTAFVNIPIMLVESIECRDIVHIYIYLKVAKTVRITFSSNEKALIWYTRINAAITRLYKLNELFSFAFYSWNEKPDECSFVNSSPTDLANLVHREFKRMKFDSKLWRMSDVNRKFELCSTYPETVIVPRCITDDQLRKVACFRSSKRFPAVVWRSRKTGAVLARSSQPNVGLLAWRLNEDELLLKAIADCCHLSATNSSKHHHNHHNHNGSHYSNSNHNSHSNGAGAVTSSAITTNTVTANTTSSNASTTASSTAPISQQQQAISNQQVNTNTQGANGLVNGVDSTVNKLSPIGTPLLLILDARFRSVALANRVKGGGYEYTEYYTNCEIQFMNLENIHVIRSSFQSLRSLCQSVVDNKQFLSQLEATKWLQHVSGIMKAAYTTCATVDQLGKPVLVHCSDGWDRTPQILALAKLCLDPYYRTLTGLRTLIEIEWLAFGHKFAQRNGHANNYNDVNERCPVFLQWLDCVYQLTRQFPSAFQFNEVCLLKLCYHAYSCLFGTFLCDSTLERQQNRVDEDTFSVWSYLNERNREIVNHLYDDTYDEVLYPNYELVNLQLWQRLFCEPEITYLVKVDHSKQYDMHAFNDSIDGCLYGSSPVAANDAMLSGADLNSSSSCNQNMNSLLQNAIDTNASAIFTSSVSNQKANSSSNLNKSRSFDDLTSKLREGSEDTASTTGTSPSSPPQPGSLTGSGDPVVAMVKCSSESNLLLDALKSASPKSTQNATSFSFKSSNGNNVESATGQPCNVLSIENEEGEKRPALLMVATNGSSSETGTPATTTPNENRSTSQSQMSSSESSSQSPSPPVETVISTNSHSQAVTNPASYKQLLLMQNSTETLVDEAQVILNKLALSSTNDELRPANGHIIEPVVTTSSSEQSSQPTSSSNSSTLPSPCGQAPLGRTTNTVSTSTNGLDEYIETNCELTTEPASSNNKQQQTGNNNNNKLTPNMLMMMRSQQQHLNDTIRYFERNFVNTFDDFYIEENVNGGDFFLNDFYNYNQTTQQGNNTNNKMPSTTGISNGSRRNDDSDRKLYDVNSGSYGSKRYVSSASKSIPIVNNKNGDKSVSVKKSNVKTIKDCIDIDGLTRVDDRSYRKIIERDEKYKREILFLRDQVNKCKWFFNKLATSNHQDVVSANGDFLFNTDYMPESCQSEENQSNCYSFSNDSMCSSWDEIDESDYKLASWVPDYYVTHCQGCNNKFSYRLRKHHCRNCGQVFCYKCADQFYPLPKYNLTAPVRVCHACEILLEKQPQSLQQQQQPVKSRNGSSSSFGNTRSQHLYSSPSSNLVFSSTPPFAADMLSNSPNNSHLSSNNSNKIKLLNPIYGPTRDQHHHHQSGSPSSSRCNQNLDLSKFRKSGGSDQKVSV